MISVVNGMLIARRFKKDTESVGMASLGDGATSTGAFHEAINQAAVEKLPLVLVITNNQFAYSTPNERQFACHDLIDKAVGYGIAGHAMNGTDLVECTQVVNHAVAQARAGHGPQLVVARILRLCGHGEHDDFSYIDAKMKNSPLGRDCLQTAESQLIQRGWIDTAALRNIYKESARKVEEAVAQVQHEPPPDPYKEDWCAISSRHLIEVFETP
jgi:pyruvate dehydrogenase E1 component alpha subunit/2-oxoisovalerate dehydrogenase E1 component alpha subunit